MRKEEYFNLTNEVLEFEQQKDFNRAESICLQIIADIEKSARPLSRDDKESLLSAWSVLGRIYKRQGQIDLAIAQWQKVVEEGFYGALRLLVSGSNPQLR